MLHSVTTAVLLVAVALLSSASSADYEQNVLARFYPNFAQLYRPATPKPYRDGPYELFQFLFTEKEYSQILEESITMLFVNITERTITYHPTPNFEVAGSRYLYRPDPSENDFVEIELISSEDHLFREVRRPNRYFHLPSLDGLQHIKQAPIQPFYEITFICNSSFPKDNDKQSPVLSYIDKSFQWTPRYEMDLSSVIDNSSECKMYAYADIRNNGEQTIIIKGVEFITRNDKLVGESDEIISIPESLSTTEYSLDQNAGDTHVYNLSLSLPIKLSPNSIKSVQFVEPSLYFGAFIYYNSSFSNLSSTGKLFKAFNITSAEGYLPSGHLLLREEGRFIGELNLPYLIPGEAHTMIYGYDPDVLYRRQVTIIENEENSDAIIYNVEYEFENRNLLEDVYLEFVESFNSLKDFQIKNITRSYPEKNIKSLDVEGALLHGTIFIPHQYNPKIFSYQIITNKIKKEVMSDDNDNRDN